MVSLDEVLSTVNIGVGPFWVVCGPLGGLFPCEKLAFAEFQRSLVSSECSISDALKTMTFQIRFINDPETHLIC